MTAGPYVSRQPTIGGLGDFDESRSTKPTRLRSPHKIFGLAALLACSALVASAGTIITSTAGLTVKNFNSSGSDGAGDTIGGGSFFNSAIGEEMLLTNGSTITFTFASPLATFGFDQGGDGGSITAITLSNGDTISTPLPFSVGNGLYGVTSTTNFTSATITVGVPGPRSFVITDFRLGSAATTPEPSTLALVVPLLLVGLTSLRLRKRGVR